MLNISAARHLYHKSLCQEFGVDDIEFVEESAQVKSSKVGRKFDSLPNLIVIFALNKKRYKVSVPAITKIELNGHWPFQYPVLSYDQQAMKNEIARLISSVVDE